MSLRRISEMIEVTTSAAVSPPVPVGSTTDKKEKKGKKKNKILVKRVLTDRKDVATTA
jgi:hypothetical protein